MPSFIVHTIPGSPAARAVMAALIEKGAPFRVAGLAPGAHRMEPHLSRHPFGKMPVLEHDDFALYETQAILRYLERAIPSPPLIPKEPQRRGEEWIRSWESPIDICFRESTTSSDFTGSWGHSSWGSPLTRRQFQRLCLGQRSYSGYCLVCLARRTTSHLRS